MFANILYVEDEPFFREVLVPKLEGAGLQVVSAQNAGEALKELAQRHVDLILLDIGLPGMNGLELLGQLKQQEPTKDIPVIMLTNQEEGNEHARATALGADAFLVKVLTDPKDLVGTINDVLARHQGVAQGKQRPVGQPGS